MLKAVDIAPLGACADPTVLAEIAAAAEESGWDGLSTWDILGTAWGDRAPDPFVALAAVACATHRLKSQIFSPTRTRRPRSSLSFSGA